LLFAPLLKHRIVRLSFVACLWSSAGCVFAQSAIQPVGRPLNAQEPQWSGLYRGQRGDCQFEMRLQRRPEANDSYEGQYFCFGEGIVKRIVAEIEVEGEIYTFWAEESENGTDVSGEWQGAQLAQAGGVVVWQGQWSNVQGEPVQSFSMRKVDPSQAKNPKTKTIKKP
jgi:hypothetical protein